MNFNYYFFGDTEGDFVLIRIERGSEDDCIDIATEYAENYFYGQDDQNRPTEFIDVFDEREAQFLHQHNAFHYDIYN